MTLLPKLIAFDLDDTLAPSKSSLPPEILELLVRLLQKTQVAIISGGNITQFEKQIFEPLETLQLSEKVLENLHILPTCGTHYAVRKAGFWHTVYSEQLSAAERQTAMLALEETAKRLGLWEQNTWGQIIEDRGSQITFSALGQQAPPAVKSSWDPDGQKKNLLAQNVQLMLPHLEVRSGGSTSVDITRKGIDKAYGMRKLAAHTNIDLADMLFIGDRLDPAGNDYPVLALGVTCQAVKNWQETAVLLRRLLDS